jgi:lipid-binding SYLF domain-containing protein
MNHYPSHLRGKDVRANRAALRLGCAIALVAAILCTVAVRPTSAASASELNRKASAALKTLYAQSPAAKALAAKAKGVLVFPDIVKGGFIVGGQIGDGVLRVADKTTGYYRSVAASYGLQAGIQSFGYALMFMDADSLAYLDKSDGWEIGVGPSIVVVDAGVAKSLSTTTLQSGVYAFIFSQKGLMAGLGLQGAKITKITPDK